MPFSDTAEAVNNALELIRTRAEAALNRRPDFNEILSAAYMEQQKMAVSSKSLSLKIVPVIRLAVSQ